MFDFRFAHPWVLLALLVIPAVAALLIRRRGRHRPRMTFSTIEIFSRQKTTLRLRARPLPFVFLLLSFALLTLAAARPQLPWKESNRRTQGISIMLVLDVSESMRALDFEPNRLIKAKEVVKAFVGGRVDDLIGLVIFGKETFALCPLTQDYAALETFIDRIDFDLVDGSATAIGMGLANAVNKIKDAETSSKVVILLTDGEDNAGEIRPLQAADIAKELGIRVYTIGVGSKGIVDMPVRMPGGGWFTRPNMSNIDTDTLKQIADLTGGQFFHATDGKSLEEIYDQIDTMERTEIDLTENNFYDELAHWFIIPALLLFGLALLLEQTWLWSFP